MGSDTFTTPLLDIPIAGNKIMYNPLNINFAINEDIDSWKQIHLWFRSMASPVSISERNRLSAIQNAYKNSGLTSYSDATLTVLSSLNNPLLRIRFYNVFPISLSDIAFDTKESADTILVADASFMFEYYDIETA
jgi:hypothetical protein